jgi:hypothetical protein
MAEAGQGRSAKRVPRRRLRQLPQAAEQAAGDPAGQEQLGRPRSTQAAGGWRKERLV